MAKNTDQDDANKGGDDKDEIVIVETDAEGKPLPGQPGAEKDPKDDKDKDKDPDSGDESDPDDEEETGDTRLSNQDQERTERNRASRENRNEARRRAKQRDKTEIAYLRSQNELLEARVRTIDQRVSKNEIGAADSQLAVLKSQLATADDVIAKAIKAGNGEDAVKAMQMRDEIRDDITAFEGRKGEIQDEATRADKGPDPTVKRNAQVFFSHVPWFEATPGLDPDSDAVRDMEAALVAGGSNPRTAQHWQTLETAVRKRFGKRFEMNNDRDSDEGSEEPETRGNGRDRDADNNGGKRPGNGGPRLPASGGNRGGSKNVFLISPERKQALIEAGVWEDEILRKRYVQRYAKYDREKAASAKT